MANTNQAKKRARQAIKTRVENFSKKNTMRTYIKKVKLAIVNADVTLAQETMKQAFPYIDKMASKGIIHSNTAARYKHRINKQLKHLVQKAA